MSLPSPNLDDRKFQDIVDDVKRQIGRRCPEWTDHNVSDPGVTLLELFAWMMEMTLYRVNQIPEKNYIAFLEMLGISLEPPVPARTDLRFLLARPIEDQDGEESQEQTLREGEVEAATVRTESEEAIGFTTDADLKFVRPRLVHILAVGASDNEAEGKQADVRVFVPSQGTFPIFSPIPQEGDRLYLGFEADVSRNLVSLQADCLQSAATGLDEDYPAQLWEVWNGVENLWEPLEVIRDTTLGFNRAPGQQVNGQTSGLIDLAMPPNMSPRQVSGRQGYWIRCRYTLALPARGMEQRLPSAYQRSPEIAALRARVVGGTVPASNAAVFLQRELGQSDGLPGQSFALGHAPILSLRPDETVLVGEQGASFDARETWMPVADFAESGAEDKHFVFDAASGEIRFGISVLQPDGSVRQHGRIPPKGATIFFSAYRCGGGAAGNTAANRITILKSSIPYIASVTNPQRAEGGREQETLERAKLRGQALLRQRDRAVTAEDYVYLAERASSGVGRAHCVQPTSQHAAAGNGEQITPGAIRLLLVPALNTTVTLPRSADLRLPARVRQEVEDYLDARRLLTAILEVDEPDYVFVSTDISLVADPRADSEQVARAVRTRMENFVHPLLGGLSGTGWPFRRTLTLADIYAQVQAAQGVAFLLDIRLYVSRRVSRQEDRLTPERLVSAAEGIRINSRELLCTREHRIRTQPMSAVGQEQ